MDLDVVSQRCHGVMGKIISSIQLCSELNSHEFLLVGYCCTPFESQLTQNQ